MNHLSDDRIRLQKYMSECGVASRRKSEELIEKGAVKVNGVVAKIGDSVDPKRDIITLNGKIKRLQNILCFTSLAALSQL